MSPATCSASGLSGAALGEHALGKIGQGQRELTLEMRSKAAASRSELEHRPRCPAAGAAPIGAADRRLLRCSAPVAKRAATTRQAPDRNAWLFSVASVPLRPIRSSSAASGNVPMHLARVLRRRCRRVFITVRIAAIVNLDMRHELVGEFVDGDTPGGTANRFDDDGADGGLRCVDHRAMSHEVEADGPGAPEALAPRGTHRRRPVFESPVRR